MTDLARLCAYRVLRGRSMFVQLCLFIEHFFYIYKYLGPDKAYLLSFIQFPQVSNRYLISCANETGDSNYSYLICSEHFSGNSVCLLELFHAINMFNLVQVLGVMWFWESLI